jgi:hypothetical protein
MGITLSSDNMLMLVSMDFLLFRTRLRKYVLFQLLGYIVPPFRALGCA